MTIRPEQDPSTADPAPGAPVERFITRFRFVLAGLLAAGAIGLVLFTLANRAPEEPIDLSAPSNILASVRTEVLSTDASEEVTALRWTVTGSTQRSWLAAYDGEESQRFAVGGPADDALSLQATLVDERTGKVLARASASKSALADTSFTAQCEAVRGLAISCTPVWGEDAQLRIEVSGSVSPSEIGGLQQTG